MTSIEDYYAQPWGTVCECCGHVDGTCPTCGALHRPNVGPADLGLGDVDQCESCAHVPSESE